MDFLSKKKIIIVEDRYILYEELVSFFEEKGYYVIKNPSGKPVDNYDDAVSLMRKEVPDIAVLDIELKKGSKDGIELSAYIKANYNTLIVILTDHDSHENLERAKYLIADGFIIKEDKPLNKRQLWATINLVLPKFELKKKQKSLGSFFKVKEIDIKTLSNSYKEPKPETSSAIDLETFIKWECITYILSYNSKQAGEGNNNVLMYTNLQNKGYIYRSTIGDLMEHLPDNFVRFDQSTIVNAYHITARGKGNSLYYIGSRSFKISDTYKQEAIEKLETLILKEA